MGRWDVYVNIVPITLREANRFVEQYHRHHGPARGCITCAAAATGQLIHGVAIAGRPVSRMLDDGFSAEVTRCCTDGTANAASMLYRALWRAVRAVGYKRLFTYTLIDESGASLRGAGFKLIGVAGGGSWSREGRPRIDTHPTQAKLKWTIES